MKTPTIGSTVLFTNKQGEVNAAIVAAVNGPGSVNLCAIYHDGATYQARNVGFSPAGGRFTWQWGNPTDDAPPEKKSASKAVSAILLGMLMLGLASPAKAAEYGIAKTFWSFSAWTNTPTTVTNLNAVLDATTCTDFALQVTATPTNNSVGAGSFDIVWETSLDGSNWPGLTNQLGRTIGWFSAPFQSNAVKSVWVTNITVDAIGYWRIRHITNNCNMNFTNLAIRAYTKPRRTGS